MPDDDLVMIGDYLEAGESIEAALDRLAAESPYMMPGEVRDEDEEVGGRGRIVAMVRYLVELRVRDEQAFDLLCLKIIHPDMTHERLAQILKAGDRGNWGSRVRSYERWKRLAETYPELAEVVSFDRRGGNQRGGPVHPADLDREYRYLVDTELAKPKGERRKCYGEGGLYAEVARTCRVHGRDGKPSWQAARKRIVRYRQQSEGQRQGSCP